MQLAIDPNTDFRAHLAAQHKARRARMAALARPEDRRRPELIHLVKTEPLTAPRPPLIPVDDPAAEAVTRYEKPIGPRLVVETSYVGPVRYRVGCNAMKRIRLHARKIRDPHERDCQKYSHPIGPHQRITNRVEKPIVIHRDWLNVLSPDCVVLKTPAETILKEVSEAHGVEVRDIKGPWRFAKIVAARQEACYRLRTETSLSFPAIGRLMGGRDHTTAMHGYERHKQKLARAACVEG